MPRQSAWKILRGGSDTPLREVDRVAEARQLEPRDRGLLRRIIGTEVRRRGTLRAMVAASTNRKPSADLAAHLRIAMVQLFFLDGVPDHASVSETVRAATNTLGTSKGSFLNGVLRNLLRARRGGHSGDPRCDIPGRPWHFEEPVFRDPAEHPLLWAEDAYSMPASVLKRWAKRHGKEAALELARTFIDEPALSLRVLRGERDPILAELIALEVTARPVGERFIVASSSDTRAVITSAPFTEGRITIQGQTAHAAAQLVGASEGERVLDLCAAPGGKSLALAETGTSVIAADISARRLARLASATARLAPSGSVQAVAADGAGAFAAESFDAVLADVPCSNSGVFGARPGARWRFGPASLRDLAVVQTRLLAEAASRVRPGGRLVYSTCSLEPEENEQRVAAFVAGTPGWELSAEQPALPVAPGEDGPVDGGYAARLERRP
jgi:16S rRNA (cytosine967-C5)-methyltransferase